MTRAEREAFLADLHVGVLSVEQKDAAPLSAPIWYDFQPGRGLWVVTGGESLKARCLQEAGRFSLVAQVETPPSYRYASVEGPIVETRPATLEGDLRPMAHRYFGAKLGDAYVASSSIEGQLYFRMEPQRWRTVDYAKLGAA
jgi:hypothetical protein